MISTLEEFKEYLSITDTSQDSLLTRILESAEKFLETETGRRFTLGEVIDRFDGKNFNIQWLRFLPVDDLSEVKFLDEVQTLIDFDFDEESGEIWNKNSVKFPKGIKSVKVTYQSGWTPELAPEDLKQSIYSLASIMYKKRTSGGVQSESIGDYSISFLSEEVPSEIKITIENYTVKNV